MTEANFLLLELNQKTLSQVFNKACLGFRGLVGKLVGFLGSEDTSLQQ